MKFVGKTGQVFTGELVDRRNEADGYSYRVLILTPDNRGASITIEPHRRPRFCLVRATLDERSRLDGAGYFLPVDLSYPLHHQRPVQ